MTKLNENERKVFEWLVQEGNGEHCYPFQSIMNGTSLERRIVRLACRSLARKGLTEYHKGLWSDQTGEPAGAGYMASANGEAFINPCDVCGRRITYEYKDEKTGETVRECEQHYKDSPKHQLTLVP